MNKCQLSDYINEVQVTPQAKAVIKEVLLILDEWEKKVETVNIQHNPKWKVEKSVKRITKKIKELGLSEQLEKISLEEYLGYQPKFRLREMG